MSEVGAISWGGYCIECGKELHVQNNTDLHEHHGPFFDHWRRQMAASVGGLLIDDVLTGS